MSNAFNSLFRALSQIFLALAVWYTHARTQTHTHTCVHTQMHLCSLMYTHALIHIHPYVYTLYTQTQCRCAQTQYRCTRMWYRCAQMQVRCAQTQYTYSIHTHCIHVYILPHRGSVCHRCHTCTGALVTTALPTARDICTYVPCSPALPA